MKDSAQAQIYGTMAKDLEIHNDLNGKVYGVATITVNKAVGYDPDTGEEIFEPRWFKIHITDESLLDFYKPLLHKDKKAIFIGELDIIQSCMDDSLAQVIIKVNNPLGIALMPKAPNN
ncbi:hypothetical protein NF27_BA00070 [Candidatus Jidaibacter acanthamoeba]|uniref:Single-stranded DNA-binding protein n=1 Tax=Candidatus Jidaibacter acanthamoebae TaxID=86105 RepID=A0A0C1QL46_9RICK|nr:hypothetical protein [Candidatus Jidaibacter acanthamoeba]KIE06224.1 hypothetical protein NF27_BA00070 [Candidatus Jidaibacter acanthamoeba]